MGKHNSNPYREGSAYHKEFGYMQKKQIVTKAEMITFAKSIGKTDKQASADITVILSPRKTSRIGDCRGNISAQGHIYYMEKLGRQVRAGVRDPQRFRLRWRTGVMEPLVRKSAIKVAQVKEVKVATKVTKTKEIVRA